METPDIITLIIACILGYSCIFLTMWLFRVRESKKEKPKHLNTTISIIDNATRDPQTNNASQVSTGHI